VARLCNRVLVVLGMAAPGGRLVGQVGVWWHHGTYRACGPVLVAWRGGVLEVEGREGRGGEGRGGEGRGGESRGEQGWGGESRGGVGKAGESRGA
jgi:hypothetical protein